jgi:hypothetical protein
MSSNCILSSVTTFSLYETDIICSTLILVSLLYDALQTDRLNSFMHYGRLWEVKKNLDDAIIEILKTASELMQMSTDNYVMDKDQVSYGLVNGVCSRMEGMTVSLDISWRKLQEVYDGPLTPPSDLSFDDPLTMNSDYGSDELDWGEENSGDSDEINDHCMN